LELLLAAGADPTITLPDGQTPLEIARKRGDHSNIQLLVSFSNPAPVEPMHSGEVSIRQAVTGKEVSVSMTGAGIERVKIRARRNSGVAATLVIPAGAVFAPANLAVQPMVARKTVKLALSSEETEAEVPVACMDVERAVPNEHQAFSLRVVSARAELVKAIERLEESGAAFEVIQAAVWIAENDAGFVKLSTLRRVTSELPGLPVMATGRQMIHAKEAAEAAAALARAGFDLTQQAIWKDRKAICAEARENAWCATPAP
jgi:hypothetical protein